MTKAAATLPQLGTPQLEGELPLKTLRRALPRWLTQEGAVLDQDIREGKFQRSLAAIAAISGLMSGIEVASEHYRGSYSQRVMYSPIILSFSLVGAGLAGVFSRRAAKTVMPLVSALTMADGLIGFFFHIRGIHRKPGGWRIAIYDLIMGPPVFAPLLLGIGGYLGVIASLLRREGDPDVSLPGSPSPTPGWLALLPARVAEEGVRFEREAREGRLQRNLAVAAAISAFLSGAEALYSHYKNDFRYWYQWTPIVLTPILMASGFGTLFSRKLARTLLPLSSLLAMLDGIAGAFFHVRGTLRRPGGLRWGPAGINVPLHNWMYGPPPLAPLLFAASGFLGLLASLLRRVD